MQAEIDKFGRLVIPKIMRDHLGIQPGSIMELMERDHEILLTMVDRQPPLKRKQGVLVYTAQATGDIESALQKTRADRLKGLST